MRKLLSQLRTAAFNFWPEYLVFLVGVFYTPLAHMSLGQFMTITAMLLAQNATFTLVSRARQSNNLILHGLFAIGSNGFFIFVITTFAANYSNLYLKFWYIVCTVVGSVHAHHLSMSKIEKSKMFAKDTMVSKNDLKGLQDLMVSTMNAMVAKLKEELFIFVRDEVDKLRTAFALKELKGDIKSTGLLQSTSRPRPVIPLQQNIPIRRSYRRRSTYPGQLSLGI